MKTENATTTQVDYHKSTTTATTTENATTTPTEQDKQMTEQFATDTIMQANADSSILQATTTDKDSKETAYIPHESNETVNLDQTVNAKKVDAKTEIGLDDLLLMPTGPIQNLLKIVVWKKDKNPSGNEFVAAISGCDKQMPMILLQASLANGFSLADGNRLYQITSFEWNKETATIYLPSSGHVRIHMPTNEYIQKS